MVSPSFKPKTPKEIRRKHQDNTGAVFEYKVWSKSAVLMMGVLSSALYVSWTTEYKDLKATQITKK